MKYGAVRKLCPNGSWSDQLEEILARIRSLWTLISILLKWPRIIEYPTRPPCMFMKARTISSRSVFPIIVKPVSSLIPSSRTRRHRVQRETRRSSAMSSTYIPKLWSVAKSLHRSRTLVSLVLRLLYVPVNLPDILLSEYSLEYSVAPVLSIFGTNCGTKPLNFQQPQSTPLCTRLQSVTWQRWLTRSWGCSCSKSCCSFLWKYYELWATKVQCSPRKSPRSIKSI